MKTVILLVAIVSLLWVHDDRAEAALRTWDGGGADDNWTSAANWVDDIGPVAGDDLLFPPGKTRLSPINDFPSGTAFNSLIFSGTNYFLDGNVIALNQGITATNAPGNMINNSLILNSNQTFTVNVGDDNLYLLGGLDNKGRELTLIVGLGSRVQLVGVISGAGGLIKTGIGNALLYGDNTFSGAVQIYEGTLSLYHGNALGAISAGTTVAAGATLNLANPITVAEPLVLSGALKSLGGQSKTWTGPLNLVGPGVNFMTEFGSFLILNTAVSGAVGFTKTLPGTLVLNSNNTYTGLTTVDGGTLQVNGFQPNNPILFNQTTLAGKGTVGVVSVGGSLSKILNPGPAGGIGVLTCSNLTLSSSTSFQGELNGPVPGAGYDQVNVHGSVSLNNAGFSMTLGFAAPVGDSFIILNNDGNDPIIGTFNGLTNGAPVVVGAGLFRINYFGGDGNDVVLTRIRLPIQFEYATRLANGQVQLRATGGFSGLTYTIEAATNLNPVVQWSNIGGATANAGGALVFLDPNSNLIPMRYYRAVSP